MELRDLSDHSEYVPGRGKKEVAREVGLDPSELIALSSNENPHGPSPAAAEAVRGSAEVVHHYPKASHADLIDAVAAEWDLTAEQIWLSPGADGAIDLLSRAVLDPGDEILIPEPGFSYYGMSGRYHHAEMNGYEVSKADEFTQHPETVLAAYSGERIVFVTAPHNPSGTVMSLTDIEAVADATADSTVIAVDEAYGEYADMPSARRLLDNRDDIAVLRTMSKAYGLAGLRVGYAMVPEEWADGYAKVNTPFAVNEVGCRAAMAALEDKDYVHQTVETARWAREYFREHIAAPTFPSSGNFILVDVGDATRVAKAARDRGVVLRDCTSFGLPGCLRISCGTREETRQATETLNQVLADLQLGVHA